MSYPDPNRAHMHAGAKADAFEASAADRRLKERRAKALELAVSVHLAAEGDVIDGYSGVPMSLSDTANQFLRYIETGAFHE